MKERDFKLDLCNALRKKDLFVQPIQTRTRAGVPDLYIAGRLDDSKWVHVNQWIECKVVNKVFPGLADNSVEARAINGKMRPIQIKFEPGQQEWALEHYQKTGRFTVVMVCFNDGWYGFKMYRFYPEGKVPVYHFHSMTGEDWWTVFKEVCFE